MRGRFRRRLLQWAARRLFGLTARVVVSGREEVPRGAALVTANHLAHIDPVLLLAVLPVPPLMVGLAELREGWLAPLFHLYGAIPVHRDRMDRAMLHAVRRALSYGEQVLIFPEARISRSGALEPAREGAAYLALQAQVPVLPVAIAGTERFLDTLRAGRRPSLTVSIAPPIYPPVPAAPRRQQRQRLIWEIMEQIAAHLPQAYRGAYDVKDEPVPIRCKGSRGLDRWEGGGHGA